MDEPEPLQQDEYVETPRDRRIANAVLLLLLIIVVGGGILACQCHVRAAHARQLHGARPTQLRRAARRACALERIPVGWNQSGGKLGLLPPHAPRACPGRGLFLRKSGRPDLRTQTRNPGRPGFRGEGSAPSTLHRFASRRTGRALDAGQGRSRSKLSVVCRPSSNYRIVRQAHSTTSAPTTAAMSAPSPRIPIRTAR